MKNALYYINSIPLFSELSSNEKESIAAISKLSSHPKGDHIIVEKDTSNAILFVCEGKAFVTLSNREGKEFIVTTLNEGDFFGEIAMLTDEKRSANVVANSPCIVLNIKSEDFKTHIATNLGLSHALLKQLAFRVRDSSKKIADLALFDVYQRVGRTLDDMAKTQDVDGNSVKLIASAPTHQELANMVGTSREMVTRALTSLEQDEHILRDGRQIIVYGVPV